MLIIVLILALLWGGLSHDLVLAFDTQNLPDAITNITGSLAVLSNAGVNSLTHRGEWRAFFSTGRDGEAYFLIAREVDNTSGKPLTYVKFRFELLAP